MTAGVLAALSIAAATVPLPFMAISPGSVVDVGELVRVEAPESPTSGGSFFLTTVRLAPVTALEAVQGWLRPEVDIVDRARVSPGNLEPDELRQLNLDQIDASKRQALGVAFEALGYDAVSGGGVEVVEVEPDGPAAGVLSTGDLIVGVDGAVVGSHYDVLRLLAGLAPGRRIELEVEPAADGGRRIVAIDLVQNRQAPGRGRLGATLRTREPRYDFPVDVDIATDRIGGSSAGLAFALGVLDELSDGDLTGGRRVAATGTIELDGSVGEVGGVGQKAAALEAQAIDVFLVPSAELEHAAALVGGGVRVEPVDDLDDALRILADGRPPELTPRW